MNQFKSILLLYQGRVGDEDMLDCAVALARENGACLTLATAIEPPAGALRALMPMSIQTLPTHYGCVIEEKKRHLSRLAAGIRQGNALIDCEVIPGRPDNETLRVIDNKGIDLVMMTADYETVIGAKAFGSLAIQLIRKAPCPVWCFRPRRSAETGNVLAAVSSENAEAEPLSLDLQILEVAAALARQRNGRLDILRAWELSGPNLSTIRSETTSEIRGRLLSNESRTAACAVARLCAAVDLDDLDIRVHLPRGDPPIEITQFARDRPVDVIVMGIIRSGIAAALLGNVAEEVSHISSTSVLTIKELDPSPETGRTSALQPKFELRTQSARSAIRLTD